MVDCAKCRGCGCSKRLMCFNYLADAKDYGQEFFVDDAVNYSEPDKCDKFHKVSNKHELFELSKLNGVIYENE